MKIRIAVTLDIDPDAWVTEFGVEREDVRADVQEYFKNIVYGQAASVSVLADERDNREWA